MRRAIPLLVVLTVAAAASAAAPAATPVEQANALIAQVQNTNGAFVSDERGNIIHMPSGLVCEPAPMLNRRLTRISLNQDPVFGMIASCHFEVLDDQKVAVDQAAIVVSVAPATEALVDDLKDATDARFKRLHPGWRRETEVVSFNGQVKEAGGKTYKARSLRYSQAPNEGYLQYGTARDWIVLIEATGPEKSIGHQWPMLGTYWSFTATTVLKMAQLRARQSVP